MLNIILVILVPPIYLLTQKRWVLAFLTTVMFFASGLIIFAPFFYLISLFIAVYVYKQNQKKQLIQEHATATGKAVADALAQRQAQP